jgi:hypothetical protein
MYRLIHLSETPYSRTCRELKIKDVNYNDIVDKFTEGNIMSSYFVDLWYEVDGKMKPITPDADLTELKDLLYKQDVIIRSTSKLDTSLPKLTQLCTNAFVDTMKELKSCLDEKLNVSNSTKELIDGVLQMLNINVIKCSACKTQLESKNKFKCNECNKHLCLNCTAEHEHNSFTRC